MFKVASEKAPTLVYLNEIEKMVPKTRNKKDSTDEGILQGKKEPLKLYFSTLM